uniref:Uncharacterized protein n=1 Tax=Lynx canadensis TaxID=61383 RepID=A0A667H6M7_LYNCA
MKNTKMASRLVRAQKRHSLMMPAPRSLNLFTKKPPRKVPPPPAGTTRYPAAEGTSTLRTAQHPLRGPPLQDHTPACPRAYRSRERL